MGAAAIKGAVGTMSSTAGVKGVGADASWAWMAEDSPRSFASRPTWEDFDGVPSEFSDDESLEPTTAEAVVEAAGSDETGSANPVSVDTVAAAGFGDPAGAG